MKDVLRAAIAVPALRLGDVSFAEGQILQKMQQAKDAGASVICFPELALTGASCGDLFLSDLLQQRVAEALASLAVSMPSELLAVVGAPLLLSGRLYDCAVVMAEGRILGAVPKLCTGEDRVFAGGAEIGELLATVGCFTFPVGGDLIFRAADGTAIGVAVGSDAEGPLSQSALLTLSGAEIVLNPCAEVATVGKKDSMQRALRADSATSHALLVKVSAGSDESVADAVFCGAGLAALGGKLLVEKEKTTETDYVTVFDADLGRVRYDRLHDRVYADRVARYAQDTQEIPVPFALTGADGTLLKVSRLPFIPSEKEVRTARAAEIFDIQVAGLARRLSLVGGKAVIGISGGLDSTLAVLVAVKAMQKLGLPASNITAVTMPCFGTSDETLSNALELMEKLGVSARTVPIKDAVLQHFKDIGHAADDYSVTYENAQARERTQVLMDIANQVGGIVVGTGDLSEMALGWCTYNGDHMSMYGVNADVPKTLVRWVIAALAEADAFPGAADVLGRILDTPISPELLPPDAVGKISQKTEDIVGPYALHDFFLYYAVRYQYRPSKIYALAMLAFDGLFDGETIKHWLNVFWRRFFGQQFKRNCVPDGVKVGSICLSPRGAWQMPSDATAAMWLREIEEI